MGSERRRKRKPRYERRIFTLALLTGLPAVALALVLLWRGDFAARTQWTLTILLVGVWLAFVGVVRERVVRPLQTISNMLAALREGDFSLRARGSDPDDALGLLLLELNSLGEDLRAQRLSALEATALLRRVMEEIDVAVFAFDESQALRLANQGAGALLVRPAGDLRGKAAAGPGVAEVPGGLERPDDGRRRGVGRVAPPAPRVRPGGGVGTARGRARDPPAGHGVPRTGGDDPSGRRTARPATDQPRPQCGRCDPGRRRSSRAGVDCAQRPAGGVGSRRRPRPGRHRQPVRPVLHDEGGRLRDRARALTPDRGGARWHADARQPCSSEGLRSPVVSAHPRP